MAEEFSEEVSKKLNYYVYRLIDPRDDKTFYVGKGTGNRVFQHIQRVLELEEDEDETSTTYETIKEIIDSGHQVKHIIHRHGMDSDTALVVEAALIEAYTGLTNIQRGLGSTTFGPRTAEEIIGLYGLPSFPTPKHNLILINVNTSHEREDIYDQVRLAWVVSKEKADRADYIIAVVRGVTKGVFVVDDKKWLLATRENFENIDSLIGGEEPSRFGFHGKEAPKEIKDLYVGEHGMRLQEEIRHVRNPIRYLYK